MKLDLGCGWKKKDADYVGVDRMYSPGVDLVLDLENARLPFEQNSIDAVRASHVLEHIRNYIPLIEEVWRVLKPGGTFTVSVPHYHHEAAYTDPTHVRYFTPKSFHFFDDRKVLFKESGWRMSIARFRVEEMRETEQEISYILSAKKKDILLVAPPCSIHTSRWKTYLESWGHRVDVAARVAKGLATIALGRGDCLEHQIESMAVEVGRISSGFDVVHTHFATKYGHVLERVQQGTKKVLSIWGDDLMDEAARDPAGLARLVRGVSQANAITTTSRSVAGYLVSHHQVDPLKVWSFPWGYDGKVMRKRNVDISELVGVLNIPDDAELILSARVCRPLNNIESIVKGFLQSGVPAQLAILTGRICDTEYASRIRNAAANSPNIHILPEVNQETLSLLYNRSLATVSIPDVDNLSTTVLESLACGTPVIGSRIDTYKERIVDGVNGVLVDPHDLDQIALAIRTCLSDWFRKSASQAAIDSVRCDSWEENARIMMSMYDVFKQEDLW